MDKGIQLAVDVLSIYFLLGPLVFLGLYIFFDRLAEQEPDVFKKKDDKVDHPDLWAPEEIDAYLKKKAFFCKVADPYK